MTEGVVDLLELVEVEVQPCEAPPGAVGGLGHLAQPFLEALAVAETGERVTPGAQEPNTFEPFQAAVQPSEGGQRPPVVEHGGQ